MLIALFLSFWSASSFAAEMRFRPDLEVPSKFSVSSHKLKATEEKYSDLIKTLTDAFPGIYSELETGTFNVREIVSPIRTTFSKEISECAEETNEQENSQSADGENPVLGCIVSLVEPVIVSLRMNDFFDDLVTEDLLNPNLYLGKMTDDPFIQQYWGTLQIIQQHSNKNTSKSVNPYQKFGRFRKNFGEFTNLTPRELLYRKYSFDQILRMSMLIDVILKIQSSAKGSVDIDFDGDGKLDYQRPLSFEERFRFGEQELNRLMSDYNRNDEFLKNTNFTKTDIMTAGIEVGIIPMDVLESIAKVTDMNDPRPKFWHNILNITKDIGTAVLMVNPTTAIFATTGILVLNTIEEVKNAKNSHDSTLIF